MSDSLRRFVPMHEAQFETALSEIESGWKRTHWMWYIFPQLRGLGHSSMAWEYGIRDLEEARAFLADPYLGGNLIRISCALLRLKTDRAGDVFGPPDDLKLRSSMTLFAAAAGGDSVFREVLEKYFGGRADPRTMQMLGR